MVSRAEVVSAICILICRVMYLVTCLFIYRATEVAREIKVSALASTDRLFDLARGRAPVIEKITAGLVYRLYCNTSPVLRTRIITCASIFSQEHAT